MPRPTRPINQGPTLGRPSKNLGPIFHGQMDNMNLGSTIRPTRTIPFTLIRTANKVNEVLNNQGRVRAIVMRFRNGLR